MAALGVVGEGLVELGLEPPPDPTIVLGFGGDVANTAVMAARLGSAARIGGRVGDDTFGRRLLTYWSGQSVDIRHVVVDGGGATGIYVNERGAEGLHRFDYHRAGSAGSRLAADDLGDGFFAGLGAVHVSGITLAVSPSSKAAAGAALDRARSIGALTSFAVNHRPALGGDVELLIETARAADIVFLSEEEMESVFGATASASGALDGVAEVIVTRGAAGAVLHADGRSTAQRALPVDVVDAAGAGDALAGAYLATRLAGADPVRALRVGVAAACLSCRARGCALSYPTRAEVERAAGGG